MTSTPRSKPSRMRARSGAGSSPNSSELLSRAGRRRRRDDGQAFPDTISRTAAVTAPGSW